MPVTPEDLGRALMGRRFTYTNEDELQQAIATVLHEEGYHPVREVRLDPRSRIDFMVDTVGIEVKIHGSKDAHYRQVRRYLEHTEVGGLLLVTARQAPDLPSTLNGKPVAVLSLLGAGL